MVPEPTTQDELDAVDASGPSAADPLRPLPPRRPLEWTGDVVARLRETGPVYVAAVAAAALVALVAGWTAIAGWPPWQSDRPPTEALLPFTSEPVAPTTTAPTFVVVHAAGGVVRPGVYELPSGSRVDDLVGAAGGFAPDADSDRVNLAAPLVDGSRVHVPRIGEATVEEVDGSSPSPVGPQLVDLNRATEADLDSLPGIGPATAAAIIEHRRTVGRFASVDELLEVRGIGPAKLEQLRPLVTVS